MTEEQFEKFMSKFQRLVDFYQVVAVCQEAFVDTETKKIEMLNRDLDRITNWHLHKCGECGYPAAGKAVGTGNDVRCTENAFIPNIHETPNEAWCREKKCWVRKGIRACPNFVAILEVASNGDK